ncbi:unnamed protein product [Symbiodinium sp. CCMP2592]|nr:unnamed protein product [Symbiodinium sp. CCMP2592]
MAALSMPLHVEDTFTDDFIEKESVPAKGEKDESWDGQPERAPRGSSGKDWTDTTDKWKPAGGGGKWKQTRAWEKPAAWKNSDWTQADGWEAHWSSPSQGRGWSHHRPAVLACGMTTGQHQRPALRNRHHR